MGDQAAQEESKVAKIIGHKEMKSFKFYISIIHEFAFTGVWLFLGFSICAVPNSSSPDPLHIAFSFGLVLSVIYFQISKYYGCHLNPAVTFGLVCCGETPIIRGLCYIIVQTCAGVVAGLRFYRMDKENIGACCMLSDGVSIYFGIVLELLTTYLFVYVAKYVDVMERRKEQLMLSSLFYGLAFVAGYLITVPLTGGGLNPARCIGPALWLNCWMDHWIYWVCPMIGGLLGAWASKIDDNRVQNEENNKK